MNDTTVMLQGYLGGPVILRKAGDTQVANFRLGSTPRFFNRSLEKWMDGVTQWHTVTAWRKLGENVHASLGKGDPVVVIGRMVAKEWKDAQGVVQQTLEIDADFIGHDLNRGTTVFHRPPRPQDLTGNLPVSVQEDLAEGGERGEGTADPWGVPGLVAATDTTVTDPVADWKAGATAA